MQIFPATYSILSPFGPINKRNVIKNLDNSDEVNQKEDFNQKFPFFTSTGDKAYSSAYDEYMNKLNEHNKNDFVEYYTETVKKVECEEDVLFINCQK